MFRGWKLKVHFKISSCYSGGSSREKVVIYFVLYVNLYILFCTVYYVTHNNYVRKTIYHYIKTPTKPHKTNQIKHTLINLLSLIISKSVTFKTFPVD